MVALFLAPLYILYECIRRPLDDTMDGRLSQTFSDNGISRFLYRSLHNISNSPAHRLSYQKPANLHRILKHTGNYFLGTFIYILLVIAVVDFGRLILKYIFHAPFIGHRSTFVITGPDWHHTDHQPQCLRNPSCNPCENYPL